MRRDPQRLARETFDLVVAGAGIHGACAAWDAALRGLSVALVDRGDFGGGASANSLKILHGGLRYLQRGDLRHMRASIAERTAWLRIAPELVRPFPFLIATRGIGSRSRAAMRAALRINDWIGGDRNRGLPESHRIENGRILDRAETLRFAPLLDRPGATGGALWHDALALDTERLTLGFILSAAKRDLVVANYVRAEALLRDGDRVAGIRARDETTGASFDIRARCVVNATGSAYGALAGAALAEADRPRSFARACNLIVGRSFAETAAFGIPSRTGSDSDPIAGKRRTLFFVPWRGGTIVGTFYRLHDATDETIPIGERDLEEILDECNEACPDLRLAAGDILLVHRGLLPLAEGRERGDPRALARHDRLIDHATTGSPGLISMVGVKYTSARWLAERVVDLAFHRLGLPPRPCATASEPIAARPLLGGTAVAVASEMAVRLSDLVFRRSGIGSFACPPREEIDRLAREMGPLLGWTEAREASEVEEVADAYRPLTPA